MVLIKVSVSFQTARTLLLGMILWTKLSGAEPASVSSGDIQVQPSVPPSKKVKNRNLTTDALITLSPIVVTSAPFRQSIDPSLGTQVYTIDQHDILNQGRGDNDGVDRILLHAPGVSRETSGQFHVRGDDYGLQYRINGVLLPEGITSTLGQPFDSRMIESLTLITGALPAQYGLRTAGVVDVHTKSGADLDGQELSMYGGSHNTLQPSFSSGGRDGTSDYFVNGSFLQNDLGTENDTPSSTALHDRTQQYQGFALVTHKFASGDQLTLIAGGVDAHFQIPNAAGAVPTFSDEGQTAFDSAQLNRNQIEQNYYGIVSYQGHASDSTWQLSEVNSYASTHYEPDVRGDLMFTGVASNDRRNLIGNGLQFDFSCFIDDAHTLRAGWTATTQLEETQASSLVFPTDPLTGSVRSDLPESINDSAQQRNYVYGFYLQDEWQILPDVTLNMGGRFDAVNSYRDEYQFSPRLNLVYQITSNTAFHAGYARLFSPPLLEFVPAETLAHFAHTTNAPETLQDDPARAARSHSFDVGLNSEVIPNVVLGLDAYYQKISNMQDETQLGEALIFTPFTYRNGYKTGVELTASYQQGPWQTYANVALAESKGRDINSSQGLFDTEELRYISAHYIHTDYDQLVTLSSGAVYTWAATTLHADFLAGSGMYGGFANSEKIKSHGTLNVGISHAFHLRQKVTLTARFDVINLLDSSYLLHDAGIGSITNQYGERRGFFGGVSCSF